MRHRLEVQGLLEEQEAPGIPETLADAVARLRGGGLLAELIDPPELNEPDPTLIMGPQRQKNFERFFQDSVVKDEDGEPVIVYHGTKRDFDRFDDSKLTTSKYGLGTGLGHFFTSDPKVASGFAGGSDCNIYMNRVEDEGRLIPANIRLHNPYIIASEGGEGLSFADKTVSKDFIDAYEKLKSPLYSDNFEDEEYFKRDLMKKGHNGIILKDTTMDAENKVNDHYIIFDPKQAKSIFNDGSYDLDDDNFMSQLGRMRGLLEG